MNTAATIRQRFTERGLSWWPVLLFLPARFIFAFVAQGVAAGVFAAQGVPDPWMAAAGWWLVYGTLTDLFCVAGLVLLLRYEGVRFVDLLGLQNGTAWRQLRFVPPFLLLMAPFAMIANGVTQHFYGSELPPMIAIVDLPFGAALYSLIIWPVIWVVVEQLVYLGYLLPRIEALTGKTWLAALAVTGFWGLQHLAIPFIADETYLVSRVLATTVAVGGFVLAYLLLRRRIIAAMGAHWAADFSTAVFAALLPLLS